MCPRPKKNRIIQTEESLNHLLQEIYNECVEQRSIAITQRNKILKEIEDLDDVGMVGKLTIDLLKVVDLSIDKKLALAKLQAGLMNAGKSSNPTEGEGELTSDQRKFLRETLKKIKQEDGVNTDLEK
jgi:hypothetical protein